MEFMNRGGQQPAPQVHTTPVTPAAKRRLRDKAYGKFSIIMLVLIGLIIALLAAYIGTSQLKSEGSYVDGNRFQAVFLSGGQVYFGKIRAMGNKYITMDNIYYLQTETTGTGSNASVTPTLAKLGCELHAPEDEMVINRDQVQFWENLKDEKQSKVTYAISEYVKKYPNGETCPDPAQAPAGGTTQTQPSGSTQPSSNN